MAAGRATEAVIQPQTATSAVVAFRRQGEHAAPPRQSLDDRLARAGFALATDLFNAYDGTDPGHPSLVHAPTVIGVLATLAAEFAQAAAAINRRAAAPVAAGGWVLGGAADPILFALEADSGARTVWQMVAHGAVAAGLAPADLPDPQTVVAHCEATIGEKPYPVLTVASPFRPKALLRAAAARHRQIAQALAAEEGLCSPYEQALVCGSAIGQIIKSESRPGPLSLLAAEAMIGGARLTPMPYAIS